VVQQGKKLGAIHLQILDILKAAPAGLDIVQIRQSLPQDIGVQQHLDKRIRELRYYFSIPLRRVNKKAVYVYEGELAAPAVDDGAISARLRAEVLHKAHGRCEMCGKTVAGDGVKLQIDHKIPRTWGGATVLDNLWALCQLCNGGKRDYFSSFNDADMQAIMEKESVYERLAETLRLHVPKPTPSWLLEFIANFDDFQEDWQKRLRELRSLGLEISVTKRKNAAGKVQSAYRLDKWVELPPDHKVRIKDHEKRNKVREGAPAP
jgi:hypothetical protein